MGISARQAALFFLNLDKKGELFDKSDLMERAGRVFYTGNARLNKYLHLSQNIYLAKTGHKLFDEAIYAYDNGGVVPEVQENYSLLLARKNSGTVSLPDDVEAFLSKMYAVLRNAPIDKLIELSHQDPEWIRKNRYHEKQDQMMDSEANLEEYRRRYRDILRVMERMS